jgi:GTP-binding protein EngB required for normal cell division
MSESVAAGHSEEKRRLDAALSELSEIASAIGAKSLALRLGGEVRDTLAAERLEVLFVGEFNHGKTTLVNALLGAPLLPTGVTPTTAVAHRLSFAETPSARAVFDAGETEALGFEELARFSAGAPGRGAPRQIDLAYPAAILRSGLVLLDTPGVNDVAGALTTEQYITRADVVVFVLDAGQPVKDSERSFIERHFQGERANKVLFVIAKADIWSEAERVSALEYVQRRLAEIVERPKVLAVSAKLALSGGEGGVLELGRELGRLLESDRRQAALESAARQGLTLAALLERGLEVRRRAAALDAASLERTVEQLRTRAASPAESGEARQLSVLDEAAAIKAWARRDLEAFCTDVLAKLPALLDPASATDVQKELGPFLEQTFSKWAEAEIAEISEALERLAERAAAIVQSDAEQVGQKLAGELGKSFSPARIEVDTFAADVGIFAVLSLGVGVLFANALVGGLLLASAPALALYSRGRTEQAVKQRALEIVPGLLREVAARVGPRFDAAIDEFSGRLSSWLSDASRHFQRDVVEILEDCRRRREGGAHDASAEVAACDEIGARLGAMKSAFAA